jgi:hypothetical protein
MRGQPAPATLGVDHGNTGRRPCPRRANGGGHRAGGDAAPIDDPDLLDRLPTPCRTLLLQVNGYVAYQGGLHVRVACRAPDWHSLRNAWHGPDSLQALYPVLTDGDIPFAEDALGDQYLVRDGEVIRLDAETATIHSLEVDVAGFDAAVRADPTGFLSLQPLRLFRANGGTLLLGQLLSPFAAPLGGRRSPSRHGTTRRQA